MADIPGDQAAPLPGSVPELRPIGQLGVADLQGAGGVDPLAAEPATDLKARSSRRQNSIPGEPEDGGSADERISDRKAGEAVESSIGGP